MAIGQQYTIKIHEDTSGTVVFDSIEVKTFTHVAGFTGATSVKKEDFTGSPNDAFVVQITYDSGSLPSTATTIATWTTTAKNAVNAALGNGEAGAPT